MNEKVIRATIVVDLPYDNELLNDVSKLREELKTTLAEMTYNKLAERTAVMTDNVEKVLDKVPNYIFVG